MVSNKEIKCSYKGDAHVIYTVCQSAQHEEVKDSKSLMNLW